LCMRGAWIISAILLPCKSAGSAGCCLRPDRLLRLLLILGRRPMPAPSAARQQAPARGNSYKDPTKRSGHKRKREATAGRRARSAASAGTQTLAALVCPRPCEGEIVLAHEMATAQKASKRSWALHQAAVLLLRFSGGPEEAEANRKGCGEGADSLNRPCSVRPRIGPQQGRRELSTELRP